MSNVCGATFRSSLVHDASNSVTVEVGKGDVLKGGGGYD